MEKSDYDAKFKFEKMIEDASTFIIDLLLR